MTLADVADQHFTYESRLASFKTAQPLSKRRISNANSKTPKTLKWPHQFLSPEELAAAGFFYYPTQTNPDNVACFLCHKSLDGWEEDDDPLAEHLKHSSNCGWAIVASIEQQDADLKEEDPSNPRMIEARKATFSDKWPHDDKKGWKCKVKQMVDAGWKYTPTPEYDDTATCTYCSLALDGWEPADKPLDEHFKRSPDCPFFTLINDHKPTATSRKSKAKKDRTSKASRLSTQSTFTATSEAASLADLPAEDEDSVLTTATNATATASETKMGKGKRATAGKGKKTKAKKSEAVEVDLAPEPEVDDLEVKEVPAPKATRGRKRKSDQVQDSVPDAIEADAPAPKRRTTRARGSAAIEDIATRVEESTTQTVAEEAPNSTGPSKAKRTVKSGRKPSAAKRAASVKAPPIPTDEEIEAALEADLDTVPDDEQMSPVVPLKNTSRSSKVSKADYAMFDTEPMEIDDAVIEAELEAIEAESTPPPKPKAARGRPRKASAKQPAAAKKATKVEAEAEARETEDELASEQITAELDNSISMHHTPPPLKPKKQRAVSRKVSRQAPARAVKAPALPVDDFSVSQPDDLQSSIDAQDEDKEDFGNDTNLSMASQSTVIRVTAPASKPKRGRPSKQRVASRKIEEASQKRLSESNSNITQATRLSAAQKEESKHERSMTEDRFYTPAPEFHEEVKEPTPEVIKPQAPRPRGRPPKVATASVPVIGPEQTSMIMNDDPVQEAQMPAPATLKLENVIAAPAVRSSTPPPIERKESQSPQSSDVENQPPSSKPSTARKVATPNPKPRIPLGGITPMVSPSKTNVIACLKSENPWSVVDLETIFLKTSGDENALGKGGFEDAMAKAKSSELTNPEKKMTVEEWILYNAEKAEEKLRSECERMVGIFEQQGTRAMMALEGVECTE